MKKKFFLASAFASLALMGAAVPAFANSGSVISGNVTTETYVIGGASFSEAGFGGGAITESFNGVTETAIGGETGSFAAGLFAETGTYAGAGAVAEQTDEYAVSETGSEALAGVLTFSGLATAGAESGAGAFAATDFDFDFDD